MDKDRGKIIGQLIEDKGMPLQEVAEHLGIGRTTLYRWINTPNLSLKKMNMVADLFNANKYSFSRLASFDGTKEIVEVEEVPLKDKYVMLLEQYNKLLKQHANLKNYIDMLKKEHPAVFDGTRSALNDGDNQSDQ